MAKNYIPPKPSGDSPFMVFCRAVWDALFNGKFPFKNTETVKWNWEGGQWKAEVKVPPVSSGISGMFWNDPIELPVAPYPAFKKGAWIHIQSSHAICSTGIHDPANPTGAVIKSPGNVIAIAMRDVPAQTTASGNNVWNAPQWPLPVASNLDDATNYWWIIPDPSCIPSS